MAFHCSPLILRPGAVIEPGNWGRIIRQVGPTHGRFLIEGAMEYIRASEFPSRPSRMECAFYFDDIGEARFYRAVDPARSTMCLYEVTPDDEMAPRHTTDWRLISQDSEFGLNWIRRYWRGEMLPPDISGHRCAEVLSKTPLRIISRLEI